MERLSAWTKVGIIGVDAGLCWVGDPCYIVRDPDEPPTFPSWRRKGGFCDLLEAGEKDGTMQWTYPMGHPGLGVSVQTGYGDGEYSVYVRRNREGRVMQLLVDFTQEMDGEDEKETEDVND